MQTNLPDADMSDATLPLDVHQSSDSDCAAAADAREAKDRETRLNNPKAWGSTGDEAGKKMRHQRHDPDTARKSHVTTACSTAPVRVASGEDAENGAAAERDVSGGKRVSVTCESKETSPNDLEGGVSCLWPTEVSFDWETPCVATLGGQLTRVGEAVSLAASREERCSQERRQRRSPRKEKDLKKLGLKEYLRRSGKSIGQLLGVELYSSLQRSRLSDLWSKGNSVCDELNGGRRKVKTRSIERGHSKRDGKKRDKPTVAVEKDEFSADEAIHPTVRLKDLIEADLVAAEENVVAFPCKGMEYLADLSSNGTIHFQGHVFASIKEFACHAQQIVTPTVQGDEAWRNVTIAGRSFDVWKKEYLSTLSGNVECTDFKLHKSW